MCLGPAVVAAGCTGSPSSCRGGPRVAPSRAAPGAPAPGAARGALVRRLRRHPRCPGGPAGPAVAPSRGPSLPSHALPRRPAPRASPSAPDSCPLLLPPRDRAELGHRFACAWRPHGFPLTRRARRPSGAGRSCPGPGTRLLCPSPSSRRLQTFQRVRRAPERALPASPLLPVDGEGREVGSESNSQGLDSILLTALLSLFFFA